MNAMHKCWQIMHKFYSAPIPFLPTNLQANVGNMAMTWIVDNIMIWLFKLITFIPKTLSKKNEKEKELKDEP